MLYPPAWYIIAYPPGGLIHGLQSLESGVGGPQLLTFAHHIPSVTKNRWSSNWLSGTDCNYWVAYSHYLSISHQDYQFQSLSGQGVGGSTNGRIDWQGQDSGLAATVAANPQDLGCSAAAPPGALKVDG